MAANDGGGKVLADNAEVLVSATSLIRRRDGVDGNDIARVRPSRLRGLRVEHVDGPSGSEYW